MIFAVVILCATGCGNKNAVEESATNKENTVSEADENLYGINVKELLGEALMNSDSTCAAIYLGSIESKKENIAKNREYLDEILSEGGYGAHYDFIRKIAKSKIVEVENGAELYYIYPYDEEAELTVNQGIYNIASGEFEIEKVIYQSKNAAPILLKCNADGIEADTQIVIVNKYGEKLVWSPRLNDDGKTIAVPEQFPFVLDATEPIPEDMNGNAS